MYQDMKHKMAGADALAKIGADAIAYMREISAEEIAEKFPDIPHIESGRTYWAMFAADGMPLMLADEQADLANSAYFNNLTAILPN